MLEFSSDPQEFIQKWIVSQGRDLKLVTDVAGWAQNEQNEDVISTWNCAMILQTYVFGNRQDMNS